MLLNNFFSKKNIPNYLTILRIILAIIIIPILLVDFNIVLYKINFQNTNIDIKLNIIIGLCLFCVSAISDALDGFLARKYNWISDFGKFWDPIADKILTNSTLFCLAAPINNLLPIWIPIIFLIRDIIIDGTRMVASKNNIVIAANIWGKLKTINLMIGIIILMLIGSSYSSNSLYYWLIQNLLIYTSLLLSIISGCIYLYNYYLKTKK